ncbi:MAG: MscL family protein [Candidatus Micrarchaeota archaeon]|nr:MscL family protein [Candidatus Micrarchaeota archaeon]
MKFVLEFSEFLKKYQVIGLAVAFIMGAAAGKLVTALVNDVIMPLVGAIVPGGDWKTFVLQAGPAKFLVGDLAGALIDFLAVAVVVFVIVKIVMREDATAKR